MYKEPKALCIIAGETSGDMWGSSVLQTWKKINPHTPFFGVGGPLMEKEGHNSLVPFSSFQAIGFTSVLKKLPGILKNLYTLTKKIIEKNPPLVLLIDQPSFTIRLAKRLKKKGYKGKIIQLVAPTVWAYNPKRASNFAQYFDVLFTLFSFEPEYFIREGLHAKWVGHPMLEHLTPITEQEQADKKSFLALFPGSRSVEIKHNLPKQIAAAKKFIEQNNSSLQIVVVASDETKKKDILCYVDSTIRIIDFEERYTVMKNAAFALAKCGTVILELAFYCVPTVVMYHVSTINRLFVQYILRLRLPYFSLVNLIAKKEVFIECVHPEPSIDDLVQALHTYTSPLRRAVCLDECKKIHLTLKAEKPASEIIVEELYAIFEKE